MSNEILKKIDNETNQNFYEKPTEKEVARALDRDAIFDGLGKKIKTTEKTSRRGRKIRQKSDDLDEDLELKIVEELNKKHAVVHTDQFYILTEKFDPVTKGMGFSLESKPSFLNTYENQVVVVNGIKKTKAQVWLKSPGRRQYDGITFHPNPKEIEGNYYNIFRGFAVEAKEGNCSLYKSHMEKVICGGNKEYFDYLWKWCARLVQCPQEVAETAIVLRGSQGVGKNTFVDALGTIFGGHYLPLDNIDQFLGRFNFHMKSSVLIHGNEAVWGGNKKELGKLKAMITEKRRVIEGKNKDSLVTTNFTHLILSSNEDWPVHLDRDDRRFLVLEVSDRHKEDIPYFKQIKEELKSGGYEALLYELLQQDLSEFDPRILPRNVESFELKMESANTAERYIYEALKMGGFDLGKAVQEGRWEGEYEITKDIVYMDYVDWCEHQKVKPEKESSLGKAIKRLIPSVENDKRSHRDFGRKPLYKFPSLDKARGEFEKSYKIPGAREIWL